MNAVQHQHQLLLYSCPPCTRHASHLSTYLVPPSPPSSYPAGGRSRRTFSEEPDPCCAEEEIELPVRKNRGPPFRANISCKKLFITVTGIVMTVVTHSGHCMTTWSEKMCYCIYTLVWWHFDQISTFFQVARIDLEIVCFRRAERYLLALGGRG